MQPDLPPAPIYGISTVDQSEVAEGEIFDLLESVETALMRVVVVCRDVDDLTAATIGDHDAVADVVRIGQAGLSAARNAGLDALVSMGVGDEAIICFPDDDCHYLPGLLETVIRHMCTVDLALGTYGETSGDQSVHARELAAHELTLRDVFRVGNSVGIFVKFRVVKEVGGFDVRMGVGSGDVGAAEDIEFLARCLVARTSALFDPSMVVQHPRNLKPIEGRSGAYLAVAVRYWGHWESWVRMVRAVIGSLVGVSPIRRKSLAHLLRYRRRHGWDAG